LKRLFRLLRDGRGLRHAPIVYSDRADSAVRVVLRGIPDGPIDVSRDHVPVSLRPLIVGVRVDATKNSPQISTPQALDFYDPIEDRRPLATVGVIPVGSVPMIRGTLRLYRTMSCRNVAVPAARRWWRYVLAWRHALRATARGDRLRMSAHDLRCLNAYYMVARPVYLVSVEHEGRTNMFPMDLVGRLTSGEFTFALRATSPSIELIEQSRRVAMSAAPARFLHAVYDLGRQHGLKTIDVSTLAFGVRSSVLFNLPVLAENGLVREISVRHSHRVGSHVLFIGDIQDERGHTINQLAHMSAMYAEWLNRAGRPQRILS
jgi:flavin reductase (DIM6/NTAB) family NADH-FMN oxidoreductase RutF